MAISVLREFFQNRPYSVLLDVLRDMDTDLSGKSHSARALGKGVGMSQGLRSVAKAMGESMAHLRLETAVTPAALFGTELVPNRAISAKLSKGYRKAISITRNITCQTCW